MEIKRCGKCGNEYPRTLEYWYRNKGISDGMHTECKDCSRARSRAFRETNPDYIDQYSTVYNHSAMHRAVKARYNASHREQNRAYCVQWHEANKEYERLYAARYNATHQAQRIAYDKVRRRANHERISAQQRIYRHTERGRMLHRAHEQVRRARKLAAPGSFTADDLTRQYRAQHGRCYYCHRSLGTFWHADHVIPLSRGGSNHPSNIVAACATCNTSKNNKLPHEWAEGGRLL